MSARQPPCTLLQAKQHPRVTLHTHCVLPRKACTLLAFSACPLHCMHLKQADAESSAQHPTGKGTRDSILPRLRATQRSILLARHACPHRRRRLPFKSPAAALERARDGNRNTGADAVADARARAERLSLLRAIDPLARHPAPASSRAVGVGVRMPCGRRRNRSGWSGSAPCGAGPWPSPP